MQRIYWDFPITGLGFAVNGREKRNICIIYPVSCSCVEGKCPADVRSQKGRTSWPIRNSDSHGQGRQNNTPSHEEVYIYYEQSLFKVPSKSKVCLLKGTMVFVRVYMALAEGRRRLHSLSLHACTDGLFRSSRRTVPCRICCLHTFLQFSTAV